MEYKRIKTAVLKGNSAIFLIMALSLVLQLLFLFHYGGNPVESDAIQYNQLAKNLLHSRIFSLDGKIFNLTRAPGYPFFIFLIYLFFGENVLAVQLAQVFLIVITCFLTYKIGVAIFTRGTGILAAILVAVHPVLICQSFPLLSESLMAFLITLAIYIGVLTIKTHKIRYYILLGIILSIATLTRPISLFLPFFATFMLFFFYKFKKILKFGIILLASYLFIMGIWVYRNYRITGYFVPVQVMGGRSLWSGTYIAGKGFDEDPLTIKRRNELTPQLIREVEKEHADEIKNKSGKFDVITLLAMRKLGREGIRNITSNPVGFASILPYKFGRLYLGSYCYLYGIKETFSDLLHNKPGIKNLKLKLFLKTVMMIISLVTVIFLIIGLFSVKASFPYVLPLIILLFYWNLMFIFLESMTRYSIPILPALILMAARGGYSVKNYISTVKEKKA